MDPVDLLVFGPHPDDLEIGFAGTIAVHTTMGLRVGLCDLTRGELGSNGTPEERVAEAEAAARVLNASWRINLGWPDGGIIGSDEQIVSAARVIRQCRPRTIALPYWDDRHPDHRAASDVLARAAFNAALRRFDTGENEAWRADWICYYFINDSTGVSFAIDVSAQYPRKREALACHCSQFAPAGRESVETRLTRPGFQQLIESRDAHLGALTGVAYAEGVVVREPLLRPTVMKDGVTGRDGAMARGDGR
jgi:bacillithiol biosynthesis deacetylase BshB1